MEISLSTPALLFPAISLLMLAYTNRFLALAAVIRGLHSSYRDHPEQSSYARQIVRLRRRVRMIRDMQLFGVISLLLCTLSMYALFAGLITTGKLLFSLSLIAMTISLLLSLAEIFRSVDALDLQLSDLQVDPQQTQTQRADRGAT